MVDVLGCDGRDAIDFLWLCSSVDNDNDEDEVGNHGLWVRLVGLG
jgi:hypothetical protein